jgi:L-ascorbate metabolism protein UlaG (beta-lactamase superfamily)
MTPIKKRKKITKGALITTFSLIMIFRTVLDFFRKIQLLPSEPITINPNEIKIWMVGHATVLINFFGVTILTDPLLVRGLPIPKRRVMHGYKAEELPELDYIVISHAHLDHFDKRTLRRLANKTKTLIIPRACRDLVEKMTFQKIIELDWGQNLNEQDLFMTAHRPEHWGKRMPWEQINRGYNCYTFQKNNRTIFFGGDTAYGNYFKELGDKYQIDIALLPISAYKPIMMTSHHMNPIEAHQAFQDLKSAHCIPIHWGSFRLALEPMAEPPRLFQTKAEQNGVSERTHILKNGSSFSLAEFEKNFFEKISPELVPEPITIEK